MIKTKIKKQEFKNIALAIGIAFNVLLVLFFLYLYYYSIPKEADLNIPPAVRVPNIENQDLKNNIASLKKIEGLPIFVDESELGKQDPYNP